MANLKHFNSVTGQWEEIKVSTKFTELLHTEKITQDQNYANIGITNFNPNEDVLFAICNNTWIQKDEDYTINGGLLRIESKDGSNWKNGTTFNFVALKNVDKDALPTTDASLLQDGSITIAKLASSLQTYINKIGTAELTAVADDLSGAVNELSSQMSKMVKVITDEGMYKPELLNGWTKFDAVNDRQLKVWKEPNGVVHLQGILKGTTDVTVPGVHCVVGRLPVQYRPKHSLNYIVICGDTNFGRIGIIGNDGGEEYAGRIVYTFGDITWVSFDGITFVADYIDNQA